MTVESGSTTTLDFRSILGRLCNSGVSTKCEYADSVAMEQHMDVLTHTLGHCK